MIDMTDIIDHARNGNYTGVKKALDNGVDVNSRNAQGDTPLLWAVSSNHPEIVRLLVERGADRTVKASTGETPLDLARRFSRPVIVQILEEAERPKLTTEKWEKMGASTIAHVGIYPALAKKITSIFNFTSRDRTIISENLSGGPQAIGPSTSFDALPQEAIEQALGAFEKEGGAVDKGYALSGASSLDKPKARLQQP